MRMLCVLCIALVPSVSRAEFKRYYPSNVAHPAGQPTDWADFQETDDPRYAFDDDLKTAWVRPAPGSQSRDLRFSVTTLRKAKAVKLIIFTGNQKSEALFAAFGAPTSISVLASDYSARPTRARFELKAELGAQTVVFPLQDGIEAITLVIDGARAGTGSKLDAISDVQIFIDSDAPYDARVEEERRDGLLKWKQERRARAAFINAPPATWPFASTTFAAVKTGNEALINKWLPETGDAPHRPNPKYLELAQFLAKRVLPPGLVAEDKTLMLELIAAAKKQGVSGLWYEVTSTAVIERPHRLERELPEAVWPLIRTSDFALAGPGAPKMSMHLDAVDEGGARKKVVISSVQLIEGTVDAPLRILLRQSEVTSLRSEIETTTWVMLEWKSGLLSRVVTFAQQGIEQAVSFASGRRVTPTPFRSWASVIRLEATNAKISALDVRTLRADSRQGSAEPTEQDGVWLSTHRWEPR